MPAYYFAFCSPVKQYGLLSAPIVERASPTVRQ